MTRDSIEDYLYFFWAPLLKEGALNPDNIDAFQEMIILTLSQAAVYIEAPDYIAGASSREFPDEIKNEITAFGDKIFSNIPARGTDDSFWLKITTVPIVPIEITIIDPHLELEQSFGPFKIRGEKYLTFDFFSVAFQLQLRMPTVAGVSAVISAKVPFAIADGPVAEIDIPDCTVWLSAIDIDQVVADASLYMGARLKQCVVSFEPGYTKSGDLISAGLIDLRAGFSVTCLAADEPPSVEPGVTVAAGNTLAYPGKFVFTCKNQPGLPQPPKITLTHAEPFSGVLFGSTITTAAIDETTGSWVPEKRMLSFSLQTEEGIFSATENACRVFDLKGEGTITDPAWYFVPVSINHPLGLGRLGIASESGYLGFDIRDACRLSWEGLDNGPLKLKQFFLRTSPDTLVITYTSIGSLLAKQELQLWKGDQAQKGRSRIHLNYAPGGGGNFISHRKTKDQHTTSAAMDLDIDRPLLSNGDRVFLQTKAKLMLIHDQAAITAVVIGERMDPAAAFESSAYKRLSSFALANALILVNPVELFLLVAQLEGGGIARSGQCILTLPVFNIEHTLPDPYITSLFNDQPLANDNVQPTRGLRVSVNWLEPDEAALIMQLCDDSGNIFTPKGSITDEQLADHLLQFPLPHPGQTTHDFILDQAVRSAGSIEALERLDNATYGSYQSSYHSKTNTAGAFSMLHMLPGNASLVDVSGRASQMGVSFSRQLDNAEQGILMVLANTGYTMNQTFRIVNNELVSSGRFVRAFTLPHVQWEPVYFERKSDLRTFFSEENPFPTHGVPTRISSANKEDVVLAPVPVTTYVVNSFLDDKNKYAAAAHFALPFGMNAVALFHPMVKDVVLPPPEDLFGIFIVRRKPDPYSYSIMNFNQPAFLLKYGLLSGAIQIKVLSEGYPDVPRDNLADPSFHGAVLQMPEGFNITIDSRLQQVISGVQTATALLPQFLITPENANFSFLKNTAGDFGTLIQHHGDSILGATITEQFNKQMWGEQVIESIQVDKVNRKAFVTFAFARSVNAKVPLRRIDFSGLGASIFSNWLNKSATGGAVSQVKFNIYIGRVAHEVIQIKSSIIPWFIPVVRTLIIERKNHGNIIRTDSGWVATGPGEFHSGYTFHPGIIKGAYHVTAIKDTQITIPQAVNGGIADMAGVYFDADIRMENVVSGFKNTVQPDNTNYRFVGSKKQFGYIILGNPVEGVKLENYFRDTDFHDFMSRPEVGTLGGPVDCVINIAGSGQMMHVTRVDITATASKAFVLAGRGTLALPKGGSWSVVKKITGGATLPLTNDETVPVIRNGNLIFADGNPVSVNFNQSLHVLGDPLEIEKYAAGSAVSAGTEFALLQSTDTQKLLFPRPSFDSKSDAVIIDGITEGVKKIFTTNPTIADPYSLLKSNTIFPDNADALTLGDVQGLVKSLDIIKEKAGISFPPEVADLLKEFTPLECIAVPRKLYLVQEGSFEIYIDYGDGSADSPKQKFSVALDGNADDHPPGEDDPKKWQLLNTDVAIVVNLDVFQPLIVVRGNFRAEAGKKPEFMDARVEWGGEPALQKIVEVLTILYQLSTQGSGGDIIKDGFSFVMGNEPDSWSYRCTIEEKIPVIKFPTPVQLSQLPPAPLIVEAGLNLGVFFNLSLSADPDNLVKAGAGIVLGFEATIQVLILTIEVATAYGVGTARVDVFIELPDAKPTFKFTMGFGATVAVQLPVVGYVSITRVISLGASIDSNHMEMTAGQMLRGVITVAGGLASVSIQVEASGTVTDDEGARAAIVRGVFSLDITVAWVLSWDFSKEFEHTIDLPNPF